MSFKVVKSIKKNGNQEIFAVPQAWEVDGFVFWPSNFSKKFLEKLRSNKYSVPDKTWPKYNAVVKAKGIADFREALKVEAEFVSFTDTDAEMM